MRHDHKKPRPITPHQETHVVTLSSRQRRMIVKAKMIIYQEKHITTVSEKRTTLRFGVIVPRTMLDLTTEQTEPPSRM
jgi:hypothetical protein